MLNSWITTRDAAEALAFRIGNRSEEVCGLDCETEGINPKKDPPAGPKGRIVCWTVAWDNEAAGVWANPETWSVLRPLLVRLSVVGHNLLGFDCHMFRKSGVPLGRPVADTMRMFRIVNPDEDASAGLKALMKWQLGWPPVGDFDDLFTRRECLGVDPGGELKRTRRKVEGETVPTLVGGAASRLGAGHAILPLSEIPELYPDLLDLLYRYATLDARATLELYRRFRKQLTATPWTLPIRQHLASTKVSGTAPA